MKNLGAAVLLLREGKGKGAVKKQKLTLMPTTMEPTPPIAALSVQDVAITGERKSLHPYVTVRVLRWDHAEKQIVTSPVLRNMKFLLAPCIRGSQLGYA